MPREAPSFELWLLRFIAFTHAGYERYSREAFECTNTYSSIEVVGINQQFGVDQRLGIDGHVVVQLLDTITKSRPFIPFVLSISSISP